MSAQTLKMDASSNHQIHFIAVIAMRAPEYQLGPPHLPAGRETVSDKDCSPNPYLWANGYCRIANCHCGGQQMSAGLGR